MQLIYLRTWIRILKHNEQILGNIYGLHYKVTYYFSLSWFRLIMFILKWQKNWFHFLVIISIL